MTVKIDKRHGRYIIQLEESDVCSKEDCIDYVLTTLCREFECELIGRTYRLGERTYQDFLSRQSWRWYALDYRKVDRLYSKERVRLLANPVSPELLESLGYKTDKASLLSMGARNREGHIFGI